MQESRQTRHHRCIITNGSSGQNAGGTLQTWLLLNWLKQEETSDMCGQNESFILLRNKDRSNGKASAVCSTVLVGKRHARSSPCRRNLLTHATCSAACEWLSSVKCHRTREQSSTNCRSELLANLYHIIWDLIFSENARPCTWQEKVTTDPIMYLCTVK